VHGAKLLHLITVIYTQISIYYLHIFTETATISYLYTHLHIHMHTQRFF